MAEPMVTGAAAPSAQPAVSQHVCSRADLKFQLKSLLSKQLHESALILGSFLLASREDVSDVELAECTALFGDALQANKEHRRAVTYYRKALHLLRLAPRSHAAAPGVCTAASPLSLRATPLTGPHPLPPGCASAPPPFGGLHFCAGGPSEPPDRRPPYGVTPTSGGRPGGGDAAAEGCSPVEAELSFKIACSFQELRDWKSAVAELECVPTALRTDAMSAALGQLYRRLGYNKLSVVSYKECLQQNPLAVEAALALADLGVPYDEIIRYAPILGGVSALRGGLHDARNAEADAAPVSDGAPWMPPPHATPAAAMRLHAPGGAVDHAGHSAGAPDAWSEHSTHAVPAAMVAYPSVVPGAAAARRGRPRSPVEDGGAEQLSPAAVLRCDAPGGASEQQRHAGERIGDKGACAARTVPPRQSKRRRTARGGGDRSASGLDSSPQNHSNNVAPARSIDARASKPPRREAPPQDACMATHRDEHPRDSPPARDACAGTAPLDAEALREGGSPASAAREPMDSRTPGAIEPRLPLEQQGWAWLGLLVGGHAALFEQAHAQALAAFNQLAELFPNQLLSLLGAASAFLRAGDQASATVTFQRARALDPFNVRGMDAYAASLLDLKLDRELRRLSHDMTDMDSGLPEVWAIMACFWQSKQNWDKALEYVDRGLQLRNDHMGLRLSRGRCLLQKKQPEPALAEFRAVLAARNDIIAFHGVVTACLQARKFPEALVHARQATRLLPTHAVAACLLGFVHLQMPNGNAELAKKWLRKALALDPSSREAALALVTLFAQSAQLPEAVAVLEAQLALQPSDVMHQKLGEVYMEAGNYDKAIDNFQTALGLNPYSKMASTALEALERRDATDGSAALSSVAWPANTGNALDLNDAMMDEAN